MFSSSSSSSSSSGRGSNVNSKLFVAYIGARYKNIKFSDIPIHRNVQFDFLLSFGIDYTKSQSFPTPTNGKFDIFWDQNNLNPYQVNSIKRNNPNVRVGLSIGGDTVYNNHVYFRPHSIDSWVSNAVSSLANIINTYNLDGIDINYEHFDRDDDVRTFVACIGRLIRILKERGLVKFVSIAPYQNVEEHYRNLWRTYGRYIDYVNFQFYSYGNNTSIQSMMYYFDKQTKNYQGGKILVSYVSDGSRGLPPGRDFFQACKILKQRGLLHGIFFWCADDSKRLGFENENIAQLLLAG